MPDLLKRVFGGKGDGPAPLTAGPAPFRLRVMNGLRGAFSSRPVDAELLCELERLLIEADAGVEVAGRLVAAARGEKSPEGVKRALASGMMELLRPAPKSNLSPEPQGGPRVVLVVGVNGAGKTTTIAKLAGRELDAGRRVLLVAADTFRAAAVEQLSEWGKRLGVEVVSQGAGADSAAVAFDGVRKGMAKGYDSVIIDTAGRLHTKGNLMEELGKVVRVVGKAMPCAPHEKLIVIDATVGSNGLAQAREFGEAVGLTGAAVAKLDGTAKGGVVLAIAGELGIPISYVGVGEGIGDLRPFDPGEFVEAILG